MSKINYPKLLTAMIQEGAKVQIHADGRVEIIPDKVDISKAFNYEDINIKGCEGWLNLYISKIKIVCVTNERFANEIRESCFRREKK